MTTLVVTPTFMVPSATATGVVSYSLYQGNGVNTATEIASAALPTQLVFDSQVAGASTALPNISLAKSVSSPTTSTPDSTPTPTETPSSQSSSKRNAPILAIVLALVAVTCISMMFLFLWYRKRARRRGHGRERSEEYGTGPPAGDVLRKLGSAYEKSPSAADPFSDANASEPLSDPFADPEKPSHSRSGSDPLLSVARPYTHAPSASTGSAVGKRQFEEARRKDMAALNNLVRALDQKERQAQAEGRDRRSLPPVELFKAALIR